MLRCQSKRKHTQCKQQSQAAYKSCCSITSNKSKAGYATSQWNNLL